MKKYLFILMLGLILILAACGDSASSSSPEPDYTTEEFEKALNDGEEVTGKTVAVKISDIAPDSAFGFNLQAGEHLNFVSSENPELQAGDEFVAEVEEVENVMGSFIINYKMK
ncbi:hypothetical protein [Oceanobacillus kapialis]|uniref:hypothetical protein n=1 Tax=Oceanobacillus kapialis TaxID=481353 RepID=UPI00384FB5DF